MPRYDYHCPACDNTFELTQSFDSEPAADCPVCGHASRRLISHPAIHFKGSGFHNTDYKQGGNGASASDRKEDGAKESDKKSSASDSKQSKSDSSKSSDSSTSGASSNEKKTADK